MERIGNAAQTPRALQQVVGKLFYNMDFEIAPPKKGAFFVGEIRAWLFHPPN
jgi:hypothetical protein